MSGYSLRKRKKAPIVEMSEEEIEEVEEPAPTKKRAAPKEGGRRGRKKKEEGVEEKEKKAPSKKEAAAKKEESTKSSEEMKSTETTEKAPEESAKKEEEPEKKDESAEPPRAEEKTTETAATTSDAEKQTELLEHGHIYFFYRPKLGVESASGIEDVQKLYIILAPDGSPNKRVITLPKKSLPEVKTHGRHFAFVDMVTEKWDESLEEALGTADYKTKTRGARHLEGARPCGAGNYGIVKHASGHTHLAFVVELPDEMGEVQEAFDIPKEGSYVITIKNPLKPGAIKLSEKTVELSEELQGKFGDKKFIPVNPVELLNHEGMELILIGAREDIAEELGAPGEEERIEAKKLTDTDVFKDLHLKRKDHPPSALISGEWK